MELICLGDNKAHALGLVGRLWAKGGKTMKSVKTNSRRRNMIVIKKVRGNLSTNYQKGAERQCQSDPWEERPVCHLGVARCQQAASELVAHVGQKQKRILTLSSKVSSVVETSTGTPLDFTVDSPSINGEKLEVELGMVFLMLMLMMCLSTVKSLAHCLPSQWTVSMGRS